MQVYRIADLYECRAVDRDVPLRRLLFKPPVIRVDQAPKPRRVRPSRRKAA